MLTAMLSGCKGSASSMEFFRFDRDWVCLATLLIYQMQELGVLFDSPEMTGYLIDVDLICENGSQHSCFKSCATNYTVVVVMAIKRSNNEYD